MRYVKPFCFALALLGIQTMISNLFFFGKLVVEISLILIIYAGFNLSWVQGGIFSSIIGFFLDFLMGSLSGLFALSYLLIFLLSKLVFPRVYGENIFFIMIFVGLCTFLEGSLVIFFYHLAFDLDKFHQLVDIFLPQAIIAGLIAPACFALFQRFGVFSHGGTARSAERSTIY